MTGKVVIANQARDDLAEITTFIAKGSPDQARDFIHKFIETVENLRLWPESNPLLDDDRLRDAGLRRAVFKKFRNHLIVYRYRSQTIEVLRVYHAAQDWQKYLFDDGM